VAKASRWPEFRNRTPRYPVTGVGAICSERPDAARVRQGTPKIQAPRTADHALPPFLHGPEATCAECPAPTRRLGTRKPSQAVAAPVTVQVYVFPPLLVVQVNLPLPLACL